MKPYFHYISLETRPQKLEFGRNMDSFVRYFCQEKDYRSLISGEVGLVPKIVRYWSFVIDQYCVYVITILMSWTNSRVCKYNFRLI